MRTLCLYGAHFARLAILAHFEKHGALEQAHYRPAAKDALILLAVATLAPILPLVLTLMPLEELLTRLFGILF